MFCFIKLTLNWTSLIDRMYSNTAEVSGEILKTHNLFGGAKLAKLYCSLGTLFS